MNANSADLFDVDAYRTTVEEAAAAIRAACGANPSIGLILGTGLGKLAEEIDPDAILPYHEIPHFPLSTVESHDGRLLVGRLRGVPVYALQGRFHLYEGYSPREVTFPVRVLHELGVDTLLISNAAGGMNPHYRKGDLMLFTDHINLQGANPLVGPNVDEWGPRFPDMSEPYDPELRELAEAKALKYGFKLHQGVYVAVVVITDECFPDALEPVSLEDVLRAAAEAEPKLTRLMAGIVEEIGEAVTAG